MSTTGVPTDEDWHSYRKLVVDTLRRLDERTLEIYDDQKGIETRIQLIEKSNFAAEIKNVNVEIKNVRDAFEKFATNIEQKVSMIRGVMWTIAAIWTVVTVLAGIYVQTR